MAELGRIGGLNRIVRDTPSDGLQKLNKEDPLNYSGQKLDPKSGLKLDPRNGQPRNQKVDEVAKLYEKQFLREMTKAMRGTVTPGNDKPSMGENIYREQLDNEYVETWGDQGGIGLSNLIYDQMMERYFNGAGKNLKQTGPIKLTDRDVTSVNKIASNIDTASQTVMKVQTKPSADGSPAKIQAPWDATVLAKNKFDGKTSLTLGHSGGLKSTLIFQGTPNADIETGKVLEVKKGESIGVLSPETNSFLWNLDAGRANL